MPHEGTDDILQNTCMQAKKFAFSGAGEESGGGLPLRSKILIEHVLLSAYCSVVYVLTSCQVHNFPGLFNTPIILMITMRFS